MPCAGPHRKTDQDGKDLVAEDVEEHHVVTTLMEELKGLDPKDERDDAKFTVLMENVAHHIEEEENVMFPAARRVLSADELQQLGARMRTLKAQAERG